MPSNLTCRGPEELDGSHTPFKKKTPVADPFGSATGVGWKCYSAALEVEQQADANDTIASSGVARV